MLEADDSGDIHQGLDQALQPPMANGEVLFEAPWQGRVFGMAVALHEAGVFAWSEFQANLIEVVGEWDKEASSSDPYEYYDHFQNALNQLLARKSLVSEDDLSRRTSDFAQRPHDHDHDH
jgi:nitrile hydratase accessory protein